MHDLLSDSEPDSSDSDDDDDEEEDSPEAPNLKSNQEDQEQNDEDEDKGTQADYKLDGEEDQDLGGEEDEDDQALYHKIRQATTHVRRGNIKKALNILTQGRLRKITPQVEEALRAKHPTPHPYAVPPETPVFPKNIVDQERSLRSSLGSYAELA